jgi:hypothetical protein
MPCGLALCIAAAQQARQTLGTLQAEMRGGSDVPPDLHDAVLRAEYREALSACDGVLAAIDSHADG